MINHRSRLHQLNKFNAKIDALLLREAKCTLATTGLSVTDDLKAPTYIGPEMHHERLCGFLAVEIIAMQEMRTTMVLKDGNYCFLFRSPLNIL